MRKILLLVICLSLLSIPAFAQFGGKNLGRFEFGSQRYGSSEFGDDSGDTASYTAGCAQLEDGTCHLLEDGTNHLLE